MQMSLSEMINWYFLGNFQHCFLWSSCSNFSQILLKLIWMKLDIVTHMRGYFNLKLPGIPSNRAVNMWWLGSLGQSCMESYLEIYYSQLQCWIQQYTRLHKSWMQKQTSYDLFPLWPPEGGVLDHIWEITEEPQTGPMVWELSDLMTIWDNANNPPDSSGSHPRPVCFTPQEQWLTIVSIGIWFYLFSWSWALWRHLSVEWMWG